VRLFKVLFVTVFLSVSSGAALADTVNVAWKCGDTWGSDVVFNIKDKDNNTVLGDIPNTDCSASLDLDYSTSLYIEACNSSECSGPSNLIYFRKVVPTLKTFVITVEETP